MAVKTSKRLLVSEKTLELNVAAEILTLVRRRPGCEGAFWIGLTQRQERRFGFDERLSNVAPGLHMALQFKAPARERAPTGAYRFTLRHGQHAALLRLAAFRRSAAHYVFPEAERWLEEHGHLRRGIVGSDSANGAATASTAPPHDREVSPDGEAD
jgi:hypothetical protein